MMSAAKHLILATIIDVLPGQVTYPACVTCYTKLHHLSTSNKFQCQRCGKLYEVSEVHHRYRLAIKATNQSVCREVTVFGSCLDPFFGVDATTFSRYMQHIAQHHRTAYNELDLLHASITYTLVGHPFYFGFKTAGNFSLQNNDSSVPLANIVGRDNENLVAVQMNSPFRTWNFPTVVQSLIKLISTQNGRLLEKGEYVGCTDDDGQGVCPVIAIPQNQNEGEKVENDLEATSHPGKREASMMQVLDLTCSRRDATCNESCGSTSFLGETFFSRSIPSFRLSCDKNLSTTNTDLSRRTSNDSSQLQQSDQCDSTGTNHHATSFHHVAKEESHSLPICTSDVMINRQDTSIHESNSVHKNFLSTEKASANLTLPECFSKGDQNEERCGKSVQVSHRPAAFRNNCEDECAMDDIIENRQMEEIPVQDIKDICSSNNSEGRITNVRTEGHEQDAGVDINDSSIIQECEQYMNEWLEVNSFDGWSYQEPFQNLSQTHTKSCCLDKKASKLGTPCIEGEREEGRANRTPHPDPSHASTCHEFPDDLPFSEDLDQFLDDVEEEYAHSRETEVNATTHCSMRHQVKNASIRTNGDDKDLPTVSPCGKSSPIEHEKCDKKVACAKLSHHSERAERGIDSSTCSIARTQSCDKFILEEGCLVDIHLSSSSLDKVDTETCMSYNTKENECAYNLNPMPYIKCNNRKLTAEEEENEQQRKVQLIRNEPEDWNTRGGKQGDGCIHDDDRVLSKISLQNEQSSLHCSACRIRKLEPGSACCADKVLSKISVQNEETSLNCSSVGEMEPDSAWCCSQSPLLFSQSQSPILPARPSRYLTTQQPSSQNLERPCKDDADNSLPIQRKATPQLRLGLNHSGRKSNETADTPKDQTHQSSDVENSPGDLENADQGTPSLFSQVPDDPGIPTPHSLISLSRNSRRLCHSRHKATPLRQLFMQRARSWKMSSTPMTSKKNTVVERSFESPLSSCGTPNLFSSESSPEIEDTSSNCGQKNHSRESFLREVSGSFECTPDLF